MSLLPVAVVRLYVVFLKILAEEGNDEDDIKTSAAEFFLYFVIDISFAKYPNPQTKNRIFNLRLVVNFSVPNIALLCLRIL
jgi:hypothetical protein